jgi:hypothetical protein
LGTFELSLLIRPLSLIYVMQPYHSKILVILCTEQIGGKS